MKKLCFSVMFAALTAMASAQGVDTTYYEPKLGLELNNKWLMSAGDGKHGIDLDNWKALTEKMANPSKAVSATMLDGKIYIACSQDLVPMDDGTGEIYEILEAYSHILVLDAETGEFINDLKLTHNGTRYGGLLGSSSIGTDDFGHIWIMPYVSQCFDDYTEAIQYIPLYLLDTESGDLTHIHSFQFDGLENAIANGRIDHCDVMGNIVGDNDGCSFIVLPNESLSAYVWTKPKGCHEWGLTYNSYNIDIIESYPSNSVQWGYSPVSAFVHNGNNYNANNFWTDGHATTPALYNMNGNMISSFEQIAKDVEENASSIWAEYIPERIANGVKQFTFNGEEYLVYALKFPNGEPGGQMAIVKLGKNGTLENATPLWIAPNLPDKLGTNKGEGRFAHFFAVSPEYSLSDGRKAIDIMLYKDSNGIGVYQIAEADTATPKPTQYIADNSEQTVYSIPAGTMSAIQFDVTAPEGVEFEISESAASQMSVHKEAIDATTVRYVAYTNDGEALNVDFTCTATAAETTGSTLRISNIILSVNDEPVKEKDIEFIILGYPLEGLTLPDVKVGSSTYLAKPAELSNSDVTVTWEPYTSQFGTLTADGMFTALANGTINDLRLNITDNRINVPLEATAILNIYGMYGDADESDAVDIADVIAIVNYILMKNPEPFDFNAADLDGNGEINVADITRLIKIILAQPAAVATNAAQRAQSMNREIKVTADSQIVDNNGNQHLNIALDTDRNYTAMQLDIELTEGVGIESIKAGAGISTHIVADGQVNETTNRVVIYSLGLDDLPVGEALLDITLTKGNIPVDARVKITSAITADADGQAYSHTSIDAALGDIIQGVVDLNNIYTKVYSNNGTIYVEAVEDASVRVIDLQGRLVGAWTGNGSVTAAPGIYIVTCDGMQPQKVEVR